MIEIEKHPNYQALDRAWSERIKSVEAAWRSEMRRLKGDKAARRKAELSRRLRIVREQREAALAAMEAVIRALEGARDEESGRGRAEVIDLIADELLKVRLK